MTSVLHNTDDSYVAGIDNPIPVFHSHSRFLSNNNKHTDIRPVLFSADAWRPDWFFQGSLTIFFTTLIHPPSRPFP